MSDTLSLAECQAIVEGWREDQHPRGFGGKFGSGTGVAKSDDSGGSRPAASGASASKAPAKKAPAAKKTPTKASTPAPAKTSTSAKAPAKTSTRAPASKTPKGKAAPPEAAPAKSAPAKDKAFLTDHYGEWRGKLSAAQSKALTGYQGDDYDLMNGQARGNSKADEAEVARAAKANAALKAAINKAPPTTEPMTVYRSVPAGALGGLKANMTVTDKGFVSTSLTPGKDGKQATVEITLPEGTKAAAGTNREMVLPPGGKFKVVEVGEKDGAPHVRMEYVPPAVRKSRAKPKADADPTSAPEPKPAAKPKAKTPAAKKAPASAPAKAAPAKPAPDAKPEPKASPEPAPAEPETAPETPKKAPAKAKAAAEAEPATGMLAATRHKTDDEGAKWLGKAMPNPKKEPFTAADRKAIRAYIGPGFESINEALREPKGSRDADVQADIDGLDAVMAKSTVPEDVIVHRGLGPDFAARLGANINDPESMRAMIGKVSVEDSYLSTSTGQQASFQREIQLMMRVPKGTRAVNAMPISAHKNERELLLDRGMSWVVHDAYESKGFWHVEVEAVPNGWQPGPGWKAAPAGDADAGYTAIPTADTGSVDDLYLQDMIDQGFEV